MALKVAIVGLPNVGKSTLFNALTQTAAAQAANYPFCTIEPNVGDVAVPEPRLDELAAIAKSKEIIPARINFVDVAGLVRGAVEGRRPRQPVPGQHPRLRRRRLRRPLLRGRRRHPRRGPGRSHRRPGDHRDRADAGRPGEPGEARQQPGETRQGRREGERDQDSAPGQPGAGTSSTPAVPRAWPRSLWTTTTRPGGCCSC